MKPASIRFTVTVVTMAVCCCATIAYAQMNTATTPTDPLLSLTQAVARFENNLLTLAEAMPADKFNFAPSKDIFKPGSPAEFATVRTFAQQLTHVSGEPFRLLAPFGIKPDADVDVKSFDSLGSKDDIIKALKASFEYQNKVIAGITPQNALTPAGPRGVTRVAALVAILSDDGDHYGQMVEYLRMNGIVPPATANRLHRMAQVPPQK
jgi:hypothetical protein